MKTIGLLGGMSWESSIEYYRIINEVARERLGGLHSAQCLMYSFDFAEIDGWLARNGFFTADIGLSPDDVFLEETKEAKLARIASLDCSIYIDDLPEILLHPAFPSAVQRVLFDPAGVNAAGPQWRCLRSWTDAPGLLLQKVMS